MANPEHLAILKQGVEVWNRWRQEHPEVRPDLSGAELSGAALNKANFSQGFLKEARLTGAKLAGADFTHADLEGATFEEAELTGANLGRSNVSGAKFAGANLQHSIFSIADMTSCNLSGTDLTEAAFPNALLLDANLSSAHLRGANLFFANLQESNVIQAALSEAYMMSTVMAGLDLSEATGLETVRHWGPSSVGIDTIYKSRGNIPEVFLRGCGVPDDMIAYIRSIAGTIEFYSCFISYSTKDQEFADRLYADLQAKGVRCWFAPHDIKGGRKIHEQIDEAIRVHDKLLLILSESSMASDWVGTEIADAREREAQEKKQMLFPITVAPFEDVKRWKLFDADRGKDSAREVREYFIPDFSNWKDHDSYQKAFTRLVSDLKAESK